MLFECLTPSKWYDSYQRGLKLKDVFSAPPVASLQDVARKFYDNTKPREPIVDLLASSTISTTASITTPAPPEVTPSSS